MFIPFQNLHDQSRIWIFQSSRRFNSQEAEIISDALSTFTNGWVVHGSAMKASFDLRFNQFIILAADEQANAASGCSIDDSVRTLKKLGAQLNIDFFDRTKVAFKNEQEVITIPIASLKRKLEEKVWSTDSLMFNNLVSTKQSLHQDWLIPAGSSWLKRYLPHETLAG